MWKNDQEKFLGYLKMQFVTPQSSTCINAFSWHLDKGSYAIELS